MNDAHSKHLERKIRWQSRARFEALKLSKSFEVPRVASLTADSFFSTFYARNEPCIIIDWLNEVQCRHWTPEYFAKNYGSIKVEIMFGRESDAHYEMSLTRTKTVTIRDYVQTVIEDRQNNDVYMVAANNVLAMPAMQPLLDDLPNPPGLFDRSRRVGKNHLWFGAKGTVTGMHHDLHNILSCQIYGSKRVILASPLDADKLYNTFGNYSLVNAAAPDLERFPLFSKAHLVDFELHAGEILFLPVGWYHYLESQSVSISVSMSNFTVPNRYPAFSIGD